MNQKALLVFTLNSMMFRLSRPFQSLSNSYNARNVFDSAAQCARTLTIKPAIKCTLVPQARILSTSSASFRCASLRHAAAGSQARSNFWNTSSFKSATALAGISLGLTGFLVQRQPVSCDAPPPKPSARASSSPDSTPKGPPPLPPPPRSSLNTFELGFGTVAGICAGVFIKKGAKLLAFTLGGVFVLLQYFVNLRLVRVNWSRAESRFQDMFYSRERVVEGEVVKRPPTLLSLWRWLVDFLTADFPPRASFIAGMALGLRIG